MQRRGNASDVQRAERLLRQMYETGAFAMAEDSGEIHFYQSTKRALFPNCQMHVSKSLRRRIAKGGFRITFDHAFAEVIEACRRSEGSWLNDELISWYIEAHRRGWAHSCEVWGDQELAGGVYGVAVGATFSAESMFHRKTDMGKIALHSLMKKCLEMGFMQFDAQIINKHTESLGCVEVDASEFIDTLTKNLDVRLWD